MFIAYKLELELLKIIKISNGVNQLLLLFELVLYVSGFEEVT